MLSPAAQHRDRLASAYHAVPLPVSGAPVATVPDSAVGDTTKMLRIRLADDVRRLATMRSLTRANAFKRSILPYYWDYCSAIISRPAAHSDSIVTRLCIWCFDIGDYSNGLKLAEFALSHYLVKPCGYRHTLTPEGFTRNLAEVLAEILSDNVLKSTEPMRHVGQLQAVLDITRQHDMNDHISAKLHRAYALAVSSTDPMTAIKHYTESNQLRPLASNSKAIARLEKIRGTPRD